MIQDLDMWKKHFVAMATNKRPTENVNFYVVGHDNNPDKVPQREPSINLVTPTAQAVDRAKADLKREKTKSIRISGHTKKHTASTKKSKQKNSVTVSRVKHRSNSKINSPKTKKQKQTKRKTSQVTRGIF